MLTSVLPRAIERHTFEFLECKDAVQLEATARAIGSGGLAEAWPLILRNGYVQAPARRLDSRMTARAQVRHVFLHLGLGRASAGARQQATPRDGPVHLPALEAAMEPPPPAPLKWGDVGPDVIALQRILASLGCLDPRRVDSQ